MKRALIVIFSLMFLMGAMLGSASAADTIKVGVVLPLTGKLAKFGEIENKSFLMAVDEINAAGGDSTGKPDVGRSAIEKLISQDKVPVIGGGYSSSVTWATIAVAQQNKVPFLVNTGSADKITEQGWEYIFRLNPPVSEYPGGFAKFVTGVAKDIKNVAILYENSLFGQSGSKKFVKQAEALGMKVLMKEGYEAGAIDFKGQSQKTGPGVYDLLHHGRFPADAPSQRAQPESQTVRGRCRRIYPTRISQKCR